MEKKHGFKNLFAARRGKADSEKTSPGKSAPTPQPAAALAPEIVAIITTILEIELKLYLAPAESRMTFINGKNNSGWDTVGKQLLNPYRGG